MNFCCVKGVRIGSIKVSLRILFLTAVPFSKIYVFLVFFGIINDDMVELS
jgi:hypothetical protein